MLAAVVRRYVMMLYTPGWLACRLTASSTADGSSGGVSAKLLHSCERIVVGMEHRGAGAGITFWAEWIERI